MSSGFTRGGGKQIDHQMSAASNRCIAVKRCSRFLRGKIVRFYVMKTVKGGRGILPLVQNIDNINITLCETLRLSCYVWLELLVSLALELS